MTTTEHVTTLNGEATRLDREQLQQFAAAFQGQILTPGDEGYDQARRVWNGMIDKRPAMIARCTGTSDVVTAVNFARSNDLLVAVRGGGHNVAGNAVCDGGLVIDLSQMKGIQVDPVKQVATAQPGVTWGDLDAETQVHGLATPGGEVSTTGIAGYTLSGGIGMLHRKWGLACDNLLSVEIVTADGQVLRASPAEHPDLFWAVRGGGGNFGIVTQFEYQLHQLGPAVYSAAVIHSLDEAPSLLRDWHAYMNCAPNEVTTEALIWGMPPFPDLPEELHGAPVVIFAGMYAGPVDEGERAFAPLREFGSPIVDISGPATYVESQSAFDEMFPEGLNYYWKSLYLDELDDGTIDEIIDLAHKRPTPTCLFALRRLGGAISQVPQEAAAYGHRQAMYNLSLDSTWEDPRQNDSIIAWTRQTWADLRDRTGGGVYLNFAGLGEEGEALARAGYGANYERLRSVKRRYDPTNFFRGNINVVP